MILSIKPVLKNLMRYPESKGISRLKTSRRFSRHSVLVWFLQNLRNDDIVCSFGKLHV